MLKIFLHTLDIDIGKRSEPMHHVKEITPGAASTSFFPQGDEFMDYIVQLSPSSDNLFIHYS